MTISRLLGWLARAWADRPRPTWVVSCPEGSQPFFSRSEAESTAREWSRAAMLDDPWDGGDEVKITRGPLMRPSQMDALPEM